jgi:hypothetical protein
MLDSLQVPSKALFFYFDNVNELARFNFEFYHLFDILMDQLLMSAIFLILGIDLLR